MTSLDEINHPLIADLLHISLLLPGVGLLDPNESLGQGYWPESAIKEEEAFVGVDPEESSHVNIIWQGSRQANHADHFLAVLNLAEGPGNQGFEHRPSISMEKVHLVDDE